MPLNVAWHMENEMAILELEGALTLGPSLRMLRDKSRELFVQNTVTCLVVKVAKVSAVDSAGLGELTVIYTLAANRNCRIALVGVSSSLRAMLEVTRLDGLLPIAEDVATAKKLFCT
jgi:anti-anti-sigma factor